MQPLIIMALRPVSAPRRRRVTDASTTNTIKANVLSGPAMSPGIETPWGMGDGFAAKNRHMLEVGDFPEKQALPRGEAQNQRKRPQYRIPSRPP